MSGPYLGQPMSKHVDPGIDARHFNCWLSLWEETAGEVFCGRSRAVHRSGAPDRREYGTGGRRKKRRSPAERGATTGEGTCVLTRPRLSASAAYRRYSRPKGVCVLRVDTGFLAAGHARGQASDPDYFRAFSPTPRTEQARRRQTSRRDKCFRLSEKSVRLNIEAKRVGASPVGRQAGRAPRKRRDGRSSRKEMSAQVIEKPGFAEENGGYPIDACTANL